MVLAMKNHPMAGKSSPARIARMARAACCFVFMGGHSEETFSNYKGSGHPSLGLGRPSSGEYEATPASRVGEVSIRLDRKRIATRS